MAFYYKYLECFEIWWWRRIEQISWTNHVKNEVVLHGVMEEMNVVHTMTRKKTNWITHILRRKGLLRHVIEGKVEGRIELMESKRKNM
jgi:hypothetical protein